jgi:hypothetical protein
MVAWSMAEFAGLLEKATGLSFGVSADDGASNAPGIFLLTSASARVADAESPGLQDATSLLQTGDAEGFVIHAQGEQLWLIADRERTLKHGAYAYLDQLGYRWYGTTDAWTITPVLSSICLDAGTEFHQAAFESFNYFGSGAYGGTLLPLGYDGYGAVNDRQVTWKERNRFPRMYSLGGHSYENFLLTVGVNGFRSDTDPTAADPLHFAETSGTRPVYDGSDTSVKFHYTHTGSLRCSDANATVSHTDESGRTYCEDPDDYESNGGMTELFSDFSLTLLSNAVSSDPNGLYSRFVSVDPSDGAGHCECQKCRDLLRKGPYGTLAVDDSSISDRVFHIANITARKIANDLGVDRGVSLYAYNQHGAVPTIPLEANMHVMVAPYAFNYTGLSADELLQAWVDKSASNPNGAFGLGVYDYGCIPAWYFETPAAGCSWRSLVETVPSWRLLGLKSILIEESTGMGVAGLSNYLFSKLAWAPNHDVQEILDEFYQTAFGAAKEPVKRFYDRMLSFTYNQLTKVDVGNLCHDLVAANVALQDSSDSGARQRLSDLDKYAHYVRLAYELREARHDLQGNVSTPDYGPELAGLARIMEWIWRIRNSDMIMTYSLHGTYQANYATEVYREYDTRYVGPNGTRTYDAVNDAYVLFWKKWDPADASAEGWSAVAAFPEPTPTETSGLIEDCAANYPAYETPARTYASDYVALYPDTTDTTVAMTPYLYHSHQFKIVVKEPRAEDLGVDYSNGYLPGTSRSAYALRDKTGALLFQETLDDGTGWQTASLHLVFPAAGEYTLDVTSNTIGWYLIKYPKSLPFAVVGTYRQSANPVPEHFYYVPTGVESFFIQMNLWGYSDSEVQFLKPDGTPALFTKLGYNIFEVETDGQAGVWSYHNIMTSDGMTFIGIPAVLSWARESMIAPSDTVD